MGFIRKRKRRDLYFTGTLLSKLAYTSADTIQNFWKQENKLWVNSMGDPSADVKKLSNTQWKGISSYIVERTPLTSLPFVTNFSTGNGYSFFKNGSQISYLTGTTAASQILCQPTVILLKTVTAIN